MNKKLNLNLTKVTGLRFDKNQTMTYVPVVKENVLPKTELARKDGKSFRNKNWKSS